MIYFLDGARGVEYAVFALSKRKLTLTLTLVHTGDRTFDFNPSSVSGKVRYNLHRYFVLQGEAL